MLKPTQSVRTVEDSPLAIKFRLTIRIYVFVLHGNIVRTRYCQNFMRGPGKPFQGPPHTLPGGVLSGSFCWTNKDDFPCSLCCMQSCFCFSSLVCSSQILKSSPLLLFALHSWHQRIFPNWSTACSFTAQSEACNLRGATEISVLQTWSKEQGEKKKKFTVYSSHHHVECEVLGQ